MKRKIKLKKKITAKNLPKRISAEAEFQELLASGEIQPLFDGMGNFTGYDDEAGHRYKDKEEVIEKWGLGK